MGEIREFTVGRIPCRMPPRGAVAAAIASLQDPDYLPRIREAVRGEQKRWHELLDALQLRHTPSAGNFVYSDSGRPYNEVATALAAQV